MNKIQIRGGRIIDPSTHTDLIGSLYVADGKILAATEEVLDNFSPDRIIEAENQIICPGFIDLSARLREPGNSRKGTILSETTAAAAAGVTTLCLPPDTRPVIDSPAVIEYIRDKAEQAGYLQVLPIGAITRGLGGTELSSMFALKQAGCIAVSNANTQLASLQTLRRAMEYAATHDLPVIYRPDESSLSAEGCAHEGAVASLYGLPAIPAAAETIAVAQCLELAEHTGCRVHFSRISCKGSAIKIHQARKYGLDVTADVAIHQLHLTEDDMVPFDSCYHVSPPFRSREDKEFLRHALKSGTIDAICSDHQPHDIDAKLGAFPETEPGIASLETLLPLTLALTRDNTLSLTEAIAALTTKPAAILGLETGTLTSGAAADICIFDPQQQWPVNSENWLSRGQNTPYWQITLQGRVTHTIQAGIVIYQPSDLTS